MGEEYVKDGYAWEVVRAIYKNPYEQDLRRRYGRSLFWVGSQPDSHPFISGSAGPSQQPSSSAPQEGHLPSPSQPSPSFQEQVSSFQGSVSPDVPPTTVQSPSVPQPLHRQPAGQARTFPPFVQPHPVPPSPFEHASFQHASFWYGHQPAPHLGFSSPGYQPLGLQHRMGVTTGQFPPLSPASFPPHVFSGQWPGQPVSFSPTQPAEHPSIRRPRQNHAPRPDTIKVSIPRNTGVPGAEVSRITISLPVDLPFTDFFDRVCANMDLHPSTASLGYKFHTDRRTDAPHRLSNEDELQEAIETGIGLMSRARTRTIILEIHNLAPRALPTSTSRKRKGAPANAMVDENGQPSSSEGEAYAKQLRQLREHYSCARHRGQYCRINPSNGDHHPMDMYQQSLYAKKILRGEASLQQPPSTLTFDRVSKRPRRNQASGPALPAIHLHLPSLLTEMGGQRRLNISAPVKIEQSPVPAKIVERSPSPEFVRLSSPSAPPLSISSSTRTQDTSQPQSPSLGELFAVLEIHYPDTNFAHFEGLLRDQGYVRVDELSTLSDAFLEEVIGMPADVIPTFTEEVQAMIGRTQKGKGRAEGTELQEVIEIEDDSEDDPEA